MKVDAVQRHQRAARPRAALRLDARYHRRRTVREREAGRIEVLPIEGELDWICRPDREVGAADEQIVHPVLVGGVGGRGAHAPAPLSRRRPAGQCQARDVLLAIIPDAEPARPILDAHNRPRLHAHVIAERHQSQPLPIPDDLKPPCRVREEAYN
eukprot:1248160-Prymnesium_polylepis.3